MIKTDVFHCRQLTRNALSGVRAAASDGPFLAEGEGIIVQHLRQGIIISSSSSTSCPTLKNTN